MIKKLLFSAIGLLLLASPLFASAQSADTSANTQSLIAVLTQLVQVLERELAQLIAAQGGTQSAQFIAIPTSGTAPLTVQFKTSVQASDAAPYQFNINYGDGTSASNVACPNVGNNPPTCVTTTSHTYASAGTYTATLTSQINAGLDCVVTNPSCNQPVVVGSATITVAGAPSVSIWAVPPSVPSGARASIYWNTQGVTQCSETSSDGSFIQITLSGGAATAPLTSATTTFTISCLAPDGSHVIGNTFVTVNATTQPTATITVNGTNAPGTFHVGDTANWNWSSTGAVSASSYYTVDSDTACGEKAGTHIPWIASTLSGSLQGVASASCYAGHTYIITYIVTDAQGHQATASVTQVFAPLP